MQELHLGKLQYFDNFLPKSWFMLLLTASHQGFPNSTKGWGDSGIFLGGGGGLLLGGWKLREVILTIQTFFKVKNNFL